MEQTNNQSFSGLIYIYLFLYACANCPCQGKTYFQPGQISRTLAFHRTENLGGGDEEAAMVNVPCFIRDLEAVLKQFPTQCFKSYEAEQQLLRIEDCTEGQHCQQQQLQQQPLESRQRPAERTRPNFSKIEIALFLLELLRSQQQKEKNRRAWNYSICKLSLVYASQQTKLNSSRGKYHSAQRSIFAIYNASSITLFGIIDE